MKILIGNEAVELNLSNRAEALKTRALIVMAYEELGMNGWFNWDKLMRKHNYIKKAFQKAYLEPVI